VKARLIRDQTGRTEARIRQLLSPPSLDEDSEEDIEARESTEVREEREVHATLRREGGGGIPGGVSVSCGVCWWLCFFVFVC
jgi:hypothetical protein